MGTWVECKSATDPNGVVNLDQAISIVATSAGTGIIRAGEQDCVFLVASTPVRP